jgi:hypothetical protein
MIRKKESSFCARGINYFPETLGPCSDVHLTDIRQCKKQHLGDINGDPEGMLREGSKPVEALGSPHLLHALLAGCALSADGNPQASMGIDAGDYDGDGRDDLVMDNLGGEGVALYRNLGGQLFDDASLASSLRRGSLLFTGFGAAWLDYEGDSWLDLLVVNGAVQTIEAQRRADEALPLIKQTKQLFHNLGNGRFAEVTAQAAVRRSRSPILLLHAPTRRQVRTPPAAGGQPRGRDKRRKATSCLAPARCTIAAQPARTTPGR